MLGTLRIPLSIGGLLAVVLLGAACVEFATWFWTDADPCEASPAACERPVESQAPGAPSLEEGATTVPSARALRLPVLPSRTVSRDAPDDTPDGLTEADGPPMPEELEGVDAADEGEDEGESESDGSDAETGPAELSDQSTEPAAIASGGDEATLPQTSAAQTRNTASLSSVPGVSGLTDVTSRTLVNWQNVEPIETWLWPWPGTQNHGTVVPRLSCDAHDAVRISKASQLYLLSDPSYRVFCLAPGDYRELGALLISGVSGSESAPRVVQLDGDALDAALGIAESDDDDLPTLPATTLVNSHYWQFIGMRWQEADVAPISVRDSNHLLFDRVRVDLVAAGVSFTGSDHVTLQRSLVTGSEWDHSRCLTVELADGGDVAITNAEFLGCYQAVQIDASGAGVWGGLRVAGNEFHRDSGAGDLCDVVGVAVNGGVAASAGTFLIEDNQFSGWSAPSSCPQNTGVALTLSERVDNAVLERNVMWGGTTGIAVADGAGDVAVLDSVVVGDGVGHAVPIGSGSGVVELIRNHFVRTDRWLDSQRSALTLSCNAVAASGLPSTPVGSQTLITASSYFSALPGPVATPGGQDQVAALTSERFGPLCLSTHALSDPSTQCLSDAARYPESVQCGSDYWVAQ